MSCTRREDVLPFHRPFIGDEEIAEVTDTLKSGWLTMGPKTVRFEEKFAAAVGAEHAVAVSSCTAGLHLSIEALGLEPGDEVITSPYTFPSTIAAIAYAGATPVLVDTLEDFPNIDPSAVREAVTDRTRAIVPIHFSGAPCDLDALSAIAEDCGAEIVEDAAHAVGARYKGRPIGSIGRATVFSLYAGKNITSGEGGVVTTDDAELAARLRMTRLHGISRDAWKRYTAEGSWYYEVEERGYKYNLTDINAAIAIHQLDRLEAWQRRRYELTGLYDEELADVPGLILPRPPEYGETSWHLYVVRLDPQVVAATRSDVIEMLRADNISTSVHFIPAHRHRHFQERFGFTPDQCPNAFRLYEQSISMPLFPIMSDDDVRSVTRSLRRIATENAR